MKKARISTISVLMLIAMAGCANVDSGTRQPFSETIKRYKRIGVVSAVGSEVTRLRVGLTVFGNELETMDISSWGINEAYESQISAAVEEVFGTTAVRIEQPRADLAGTAQMAVFGEAYWEAIEAAVKKRCNAAGVDALLVAAPSRVGDYFGKTNQTMVGLGTYTRFAGAVFHVYSRIGLFDCDSGKLVKSATLGRMRLDSKIDFPAPIFDYPTVKISQSTARAKISEWSADEKDLLRRTAIEIPSKFWAYTLREMVAPTEVPQAKLIRRTPGSGI